MVRFGILPENTSAEDVDPYETDRRYWEMFHYHPEMPQTQISGITEPRGENAQPAM
jgi:hypothetical protein